MDDAPLPPPPMLPPESDSAEGDASLPPFEVAESAREPAPPAPPRRKVADDDAGGAHIKETLESIIVAFILAFIFRCFVVEAFVIPTGSMAPTLLGAHTRHQCPECGYRFDVNFSPPRVKNAQNEDDIEIPNRAGPVRGSREGVAIDHDYADLHCPNCGYLLPRDRNPAVYYGDRILVLKYAYLLNNPHRWDVVVFKSPDDPVSRGEYSVNYIKRLTGLPGETLMILDGDVYVKPRGGAEFQLQHKTAAAQEALWRIVYDDDYRPTLTAKRAAAWRQPWAATTTTGADGAGWTDGLVGGGRGFTFDAMSGAGGLSFDARATNVDGEGNSGFRDWLAYDQHDGPDQPPSWKGMYSVSDLKLSAYYARKAGDGPLRMTMTKLEHAFTVELRPDRVLLHHLFRGVPVGESRSAPLPRRAGDEPIKVDFTNVDYRVTVRVDGTEVLATADADYHPDVADLQRRVIDYESRAGMRGMRGWGNEPADSPLPPPTVSIRAERQRCELTHVSLYRDSYYTQRGSGSGSIVWGSPEKRLSGDGGPIQLGDDEYFVMGDNSPCSYDARYWQDPVSLPNEGLEVAGGRVPGRFMLGRAFFVYWPAGYRPTERMPGMVPNFGEMRFIR